MPETMRPTRGNHLGKYQGTQIGRSFLLQRHKQDDDDGMPIDPCLEDRLFGHFAMSDYLECE